MSPGIFGMMASMAGSLFDHALNQADFAYTHRMTAAPQQVKELREAGLNPALAYGQIGQSQGQALGNPNNGSTFGEMALKDPLIKSQLSTQKAQEDYYSALADKTRQEAEEARFRVQNQEDLYKLNFIYKGLQNEELSSNVRGIRLHNDWQEIENGIRKIDLDKHDRYVEAELSRLSAEAGLFAARTTTENALRVWQIGKLRSEIWHLSYLNKLISEETSLTKKRQLSEEFNKRLREGEWLYWSYLTDNNKDFSKVDSRKRFETYAPAIAQGINSAVNVVTMFLSKGKFGGLTQPSSFGGYSIPTSTFP